MFQDRDLYFQEMYWDTFWSKLVEFVHFVSGQGSIIYFSIFPLDLFHSSHNIMRIGYNDDFQIQIILTWQVPFWYTSFPFITKNFLEIKGCWILKYTLSAVDGCYGNKIYITKIRYLA